MILFSRPEVKTMKCGTSYKFALLKSPKNKTSWENWFHFNLEYQNSTKPTTLEKVHIRLSWAEFQTYMS